MARFSFPIPGRKKAAPVPNTSQESGNKAHKVLGSTPLSIDAPAAKDWDHVSSSGISVTVTDAHSPTYASRHYDQHIGRKGPATDWGDESEVLPRHMRSSHLDPNDDAYSEVSTALRSRQSSSTIKSWYDKSKQPLSVTQQTSASVMARGLPSKAQRMLDMDNSLAPQKTKKKPAKLDLSSLTPGSRSRSQQSDDYVLGPDLATKSPSVMSQLSPTSGGERRRLQKRPTKESLRQTPSFTISDPIRPSTAGSGRYANHPNGVPDLYGHYEQMSLRQIMDIESHNQDSSHVSNAAETTQPTMPNPSIVRTSPSRRRGPDYIQTASHSTHSSKMNHHSPSASVSSRHTRTSKASKRTETSFQDVDLQGKSILSLSSDSEDDEGYGDKSPASVFARRPSDFEEHAASLDQWRPGTCDSTLAPDSRSKSGKRASFAPFHTYLPVPGESPKLAVPSLGASPSAPSLLQAASSPRISNLSNSSASSAVTWQSNKPGYGVQEARAITMLPAQGPADQDSSPESESDCEQLQSRRRSPGPRYSSGSANDQPTPPLSPSSMDFYIRSAHSSIDGPSGGLNRFMAVSKQEELLLAALRQKRQLMRESFIAEEVSARIGIHSRKPSKGHQAKQSTGTITQDLFDFDFPTPPKAKDDVSMSSSDSSGFPQETEAQDRGIEDETTGSVLCPAPRRVSQRGILKSRTEPGETQNRRFSLQSDDYPVSPRTLSMSTTLIQAGLMDCDARSVHSYESSIDENEQILLPNRYSGGMGRRKSSQVLPGGRGHRPRPSVVPEEPASPPPSGDKSFQDGNTGVPRPDSPISPEAFPTIPATRVTVNKKLARLSAVGSAPLGSQPGWWKDDD